MNLGLLLKMLGVKVTPEQVAMIEAIIPQVPGKIQQIVTVINGSLHNFDQRLRALEENQRALMTVCIRLLEVINAGSDSSGDTALPAGSGATERAYNGRSTGGDG